MARRFGFAPDALKAVYNGADDAFFTAPDTISIQTDGQPTLLTVGGANAFDGGDRLLTLARFLASEMPEVQLRIAGDRHEQPWYSQLQSLPNIEWLGFVPPADLIEEMKSATALLYVPAVESFGIIGVEAMAVGLPILAEKSAPLEEVLQVAPCWIDSAKPDDFAVALRRLIMDPDHRADLIEKGTQRAESFRWSSVVDRVAKGVEEVVSHSKTIRD